MILLCVIIFILIIILIFLNVTTNLKNKYDGGMLSQISNYVSSATGVNATGVKCYWG